MSSDRLIKDLNEAFFADALVLPARHRRFRGIGVSTRGVICVVFAKLGSEGVSVISMRPAHARERRRYAEYLNEE